jgi:hypothetical protein
MINKCNYLINILSIRKKNKFLMPLVKILFSYNCKMMKFISEIGLNYNNNSNLCYELIKQSKLSGVDIVKFQLGWGGKQNEINYLDYERL